MNIAHVWAPFGFGGPSPVFAPHACATFRIGIFCQSPIIVGWTLHVLASSAVVRFSQVQSSATLALNSVE
jgi:hypothetical protein